MTMERLIVAVSNVTEQGLHLGDLRAFLDQSPRMIDGERIPAHRGEVELTNVSFTYPGSNAPALSDVSLHIKPGEVIAIVGENGAGKTTLIKLIARLYDADEGQIRFDGVDVRDWSIQHLHQRISFLAQGFAQYEATAADNIAYGDWERLLDDRNQIRDIATSAGCDELIQTMPNGYDTKLGRMFGEHEISGGQWQRLAVARTLARNASLLILDEPMAHLDARSEYELFCRFRELARGRTTILVSHRFGTLAMADRILVLDHGRIVEGGAHEDLLRQSGTYAKLYQMYRAQTAMDRNSGAARRS
jgi:ATP-binding cassette subfamily B protein